jgi:imidazolonepropionase-like amidohydrolase
VREKRSPAVGDGRQPLANDRVFSEGTDAQRYTIVADVLFDGLGSALIERASLTIAAGRIVSVETIQSDWSRPAHTVLDFSGCTVIPGLIDAHCHLALQHTLDTDDSIAFARQATEQEALAVMRDNATRAFATGVTTLRDCGSPGRVGVLFRTETASAATHLPRALVSGRPITTRSGHCHWMGLAADTADELVIAVRTLADEGVDFIKVMATGGMMTSSSNPYGAQYTDAQLSALVLEARKQTRRVAAHALSADGVRAAVSAGVDTLEHCVTTTAARQDYDPTLNAAIVEAGIVVGVTAHRPLRDLLEAEDVSGIRTRLTPHRELHDAGATLTVHSDAGTPGTAFDGIARSIEIFKLGLNTSTHTAVRAATLNAAIALGIQTETGTLEAGKTADFVLLDGDLESDIRALRSVVGVARDGVLTLTSRGDRRTENGGMGR